MKNSFILFNDSLVILDKMTNEQAGIFIKIIYQYQLTGELPELDFAMEMALTPFINQFKRDDEKWEIVRTKRVEAGAKGGNQKVANATKCKEDVANLAVNVNVTPNVNETTNVTSNVKKKKPKTPKVFIPPTIEDFILYFDENGYRKDIAELAYKNYSLNDWHDSHNNPISNWKIKLLNNWFKEEYKVSLQSNKLKSLPESFWNRKQYPYLDDFLAKQKPEFFIDIQQDIKQYLNDNGCKHRLMKAPGCTEENYYEFHKITK